MPGSRRKKREENPVIESLEDLDDLYKDQLVEFLKARGIRSTGNRAEVLQLARCYFRFVSLTRR